MSEKKPVLELSKKPDVEKKPDLKEKKEAGKLKQSKEAEKLKEKKGTDKTKDKKGTDKLKANKGADKTKDTSFLARTKLGKEAGILQAGKKPWLNVVLNILLSLLLLVGSWPLGLLAAGVDAPPLYTGGVWLSENVESVNKTTFTVLGVFVTLLAIGLLIWWNIYYRKKRLYYLAMSDQERKDTYL